VSGDIRNPEWRARLDAINAHALRGREMQAVALSDARADLSALEAAGAGHEADATDLRAIIGGLEEVLGTDRLEALELRVGVLEKLCEGVELVEG